MRAVWHIAVSNLAGRRGRTTLLILAVALGTMLTVGVAAMMGTFAHALEQAVGRVAGLADVRLHHQYSARLDASLLDTVRTWPEVDLATARVETSLMLRHPESGRFVWALAAGIEPDNLQQLHPVTLAQGRMVQNDDEVVIDQTGFEAMNANLGDMITVVRLGRPGQLTLVGVIERPKIDLLQRRKAIITLPAAQQLGDLPGQIDTIEVKLIPGVLPEALEGKYAATVPVEVAFHTSAMVRGRLKQVLDTARLTLMITMVIVGLCAGFIVLTSLTTAVTQRQRELAMIRCIGGSRFQVSSAQIMSGLFIALMGVLIGLPLGLSAARVAVWWFRDEFAAAFKPDVQAVALAAVAMITAGLAGSIYPAILAARVQPMQALAGRAHVPTRRGVGWCVGVGLPLVLLMPTVAMLVHDTQIVFWFYAYVGLATTFIGYFLLSVPVLVLLVRVTSKLIAKTLVVPSELLKESMQATPMRWGLTSGALMVGLAMLLALWTGGRSITGNWLDHLKLPDVFIHSYWGISPAQWQALQNRTDLAGITPTTAFPVQTQGVRFGVTELSPRNTLFVSFEPESFLPLMTLEWDEGDPASAVARLQQGDALLVSREYRLAHGLGVGDRLSLHTLTGVKDFEIAGVIGSAGLDLAVQVFGIHRAYADAALNSVFGTRTDAAIYFGVTNINLVLAKVPEGRDAQAIMSDIRREVPGTIVGSSQIVRRMMTESTQRFLLVASMIALSALGIACLGVSNLIVAEVSSRRFEFGVMRAMGASRALLARFIVGKVILIALAGGVTGAMLGFQLAMVGKMFHERLLGLRYEMAWPWDIMIGGALALILAAILAAIPTIWKLMRQSPRSLLAMGRGG